MSGVWKTGVSMGIYSRNEAFTVVFRPFLHCSHIASSGIGQTERSLRLGPSPSGCIALIPLLDQYFSNNGTTRREKRGSRPLDDDAPQYWHITNELGIVVDLIVRRCCLSALPSGLHVAFTRILIEKPEGVGYI